MSNQQPIPAFVPPDDDDDAVDTEEGLATGDDRPLDTDLDADRVDSAEADQRASTEGTVGDEEGV